MAQLYVLDPDRSMLSIEGRSTLHPIRSDATGLQGWVELTFDSRGGIDLAAPASAHLEFPLSRLRSGNPLLDRETERRVEAKRYPVITAELAQLASAEDADHVMARGAVSFHGVTTDLLGIVQLRQDDGELEINGEVRFDVREFGVRPPRLLALRVHPEVAVIMHAHAAVLDGDGPAGRTR